MGTLKQYDWSKINQMKAAFDEKAALPVSNWKVEPEGEPGEKVMTENDWLAARQADFSKLKRKKALTENFKKFQRINNIKYTVTASESAAATADIYASNPWVSKTELWNLKKNRIPPVPKEENANALKRGHLAEDYVIYLAESLLNEKYGEKNVFVWQDKRLFVSREYPWMFCDTDAHAVVIENGKPRFILIEAKTVGVHNYKAQKLWLSGHVPEYYERQCRHEMATFHADAVMIIAVWSLELNGYAYQFVEYDDEEEKKLINKEKDFIESLLNDEEPEDLITPVLTSSFYGRLFAKSNEKQQVILPPESEDTINKIIDLDNQMDELNEQLELLEAEKCVQTNRLSRLMGTADRAILDLKEGTFIVREHRGHKRDRFDFKKFKKERPDLYKIAVHKKEVLDEEALKGFKQEDDYWIHGELNGNTRWDIEFKEKNEE
ncbi:YqaJ viral recombinase family protein [Bilifractor sp. LCP19S3_H10]|uniref:YqaJ viral recombinase family protein n=1 Tax=Bilifractor sp. LCP19S3_H10 TaxID=3438736 RepID=UPI003F928AF6